jgi:ribonuclease III
MDWPIIFRTHSDIEAKVVRGLLDAHGIRSIQSADLAPSMFPFRDIVVEVRVAVHPEEAAAAERLIEEHRTEVGHASVVPIRQEFAGLEARLGYRFRDRGLLEHALTHKSRANEDATGGVDDNESLEFLGDAVLGFVVADMLYREFPQFHEGQKSKVKAALVSTAALATMGERLGLGDFLLLGRGEEKTGGRRKQALVADACEALMAALYLDGGMEVARAFILRELADDIEQVRSPSFRADFKSALQERLQSMDLPLPDYVVAGEIGPDHDKLFQVEVRLRGDVLAEARGRTKKEAEQEAARLALAKYEGRSTKDEGKDEGKDEEKDEGRRTKDDGHKGG